MWYVCGDHPKVREEEACGVCVEIIQRLGSRWHVVCVCVCVCV